MTAPATDATPGKSNVPWPLLAAFAALVLWALAHAAMTRPFEDLVRYPLYFALLVAAMGVVTAFLSLRSLPGPWPFDGEAIGVLTMAALIVFAASLVLGILFYAVGASLKDLYLWVASPRLSKRDAILAAVGMTLALGFVLFYFRLRTRSVYGLTEALTGLLVAANRVASPDVAAQSADPSFYLAVLTASVYLVVRGLDNVHQGLTKEPMDPLALWAKARLARFVKPTRPSKGEGTSDSRPSS